MFRIMSHLHITLNTITMIEITTIKNDIFVPIALFLNVNTVTSDTVFTQNYFTKTLLLILHGGLMHMATVKGSISCSVAMIFMSTKTLSSKANVSIGSTD